ncbi:hypothetical protein [Nonomuraea sp. PA05]|uniref:hypothetical protein n=1 Tax=Nonomuraea sp. PA05 TaxID=2604466 RepID=UPI00165241A4|nr:hypothetical protein [Nonomuraea sp. PA05]
MAHQLVDLARVPLREGDPGLRTMIGLSHPDTVTPPPIRTSVPIGPWPKAKVFS